MSATLYRGQVDRLTKEIADLEKKLADERNRAARARGEALRVTGSITASTSESLARSKLRDAQRKEEQAAGHEKRAATYLGQIATKRRSLTSAETSLERATKQTREKEERDAKRRREADLAHLRELERLRRQAAPPLAAPYRSGAPTTSTRNSDGGGFEYDVCLTFAGENRDFAEMVARWLKDRGIRVFYDEDEKAKLWGKNLSEYFDHIYRKASRYCVMFISEHYAGKPWARHERRSALARALEEEAEYILPARFDDTELDGLPPTVAYIDLTEIAPATLGEYVAEKLGAA